MGFLGSLTCFESPRIVAFMMQLLIIYCNAIQTFMSRFGSLVLFSFSDLIAILRHFKQPSISNYMVEATMKMMTSNYFQRYI